MQPTPETLSPADLVEQLGWARGLARALVREDEAEDLVQHTFLRALARPPRVTGSPRPWLRTVMRNAAREGWRGGRRRAAREEIRAVEAPRGDEPADEIVERLELHRLLQEQVRDLPAELREVVVLRYEQGLDATRIARRIGSKPATVRGRLARAREVLRERLDRAHGGDRDAWMAAFAPLVRDDAFASASVLSPLTLSALAMSTTLKLTAALTLIAAGMLVWRGLPDVQDDARVSDAARAAELELAGAPAEGAGDELAEVGEARERVQPAAAPSALERAVDGVADVLGLAPESSLVVRFVDGDGIGVPDVELVARALGQELETTSGDDGVARLATRRIPFATGAELVAVASDLSFWSERVQVAPGDELDLGEVQLVPGAAASGSVVDGRGAPLVEARVVLTRADGEGGAVDAGPRAAQLRRETTDASGRFRLVGVAPGSYAVWATDDAGRWARTETFELAEARSRDDLLLQLATDRPVADIRIRAVTPEGESASMHRYVALLEGTSRRWSVGSPEQEIVFSPESDVDRLDTVAVIDEERRLGAHWTGDLRRGDPVLVLELAPLVEIPVEWVTPDGSAPEDAWATPVLTESGLLQLGASATGPERSMGVVRAPFGVNVSASGYSSQALGPFDPTDFGAGVPLVIELERSARLTGVVLANGEPAKDAHVSLRRPAPVGRDVRVNGMPSLFDMGWEAYALTDRDGRFALDLEEPGAYAIVVTRKGWPQLVVPVREYAAADTELGSLELLEGGTLEGVVERSDGGSAAGQLVGLSRGANDGRTVRADRNGRFRVTGLAPGEWYVFPTSRESTNGMSAYGERDPDFVHPLNVTIRTGRTTSFVLHVEVPERVPVSGTVRSGGAALAGARVSVSYADGPDPWRTFELPSATTDERGAFALELWAERDVVLSVRGAGSDEILARRVVEVGHEALEGIAIDA